jgi:hypothetical protein
MTTCRSWILDRTDEIWSVTTAKFEGLWQLLDVPVPVGHRDWTARYLPHPLIAIPDAILDSLKSAEESSSRFRLQLCCPQGLCSVQCIIVRCKPN